MTSKTFDAIYENGVFRPVEPLPLVNGLRVGLMLMPPAGPLNEENMQAMMQLGQKCCEGLTEEESAALEAGMTGDRCADEAVHAERQQSQPVQLKEGQRVQIALPGPPFSPEEEAELKRLGYKLLEDLSDQEWTELKTNILGPRRMAAHGQKEQQ